MVPKLLHTCCNHILPSAIERRERQKFNGFWQKKKLSLISILTTEIVEIDIILFYLKGVLQRLFLVLILLKNISTLRIINFIQFDFEIYTFLFIYWVNKMACRCFKIVFELNGWEMSFTNKKIIIIIF
jgi:hypothetical protein